MPTLTWRLLITPDLDGPMNMAADQAIMEAVAAEHVPPTLRFYSWNPPCLSLGYTQKITDVDRDRLAARGWGLVRRITGGRAILHIDELTYSVAIKDNDPIVAGDIIASYRRLSQALMAGLLLLGTEPQADKHIIRSENSKGPVCFEVPSHYEITIGTQKLIGSAQVRKFGAVLQHGTLPLTGDITRILDALNIESDDKRERVRERVRQRAVTLEDALSTVISWKVAANAMICGFQETFSLEFVTAAQLTPNEQIRAHTLREEQYATEAWRARF